MRIEIMPSVNLAWMKINASRLVSEPRYSIAPTEEDKERCQYENPREMADFGTYCLLLFNGAFRYAPNREALNNLMYQDQSNVERRGIFLT